MAETINTATTITLVAGAYGFTEMASDPPSVTSTGFLYTKSAAAGTEMFYITDTGVVT